MISKSSTQRLKNKLRVFIVGAVIIILLIIFVSAVLIYGWNWTGFTSVAGPIVHPNEQYQPAKTLWDVLQLLVVPIILVIGGFWLNQMQETRARKQVLLQQARARKQVLLQQLYSNFIQVYNDVKAVRRLLRATARSLSPDGAVMIVKASYDERMRELTDVQLQFETLIRNLDSSRDLFLEKAVHDALRNNLSSIEKYLGNIISEYENLYEMRLDDVLMLPISKLPELEEFIGKYASAVDFRTRFQTPAHQLMDSIILLISE